MVIILIGLLMSCGESAPEAGKRSRKKAPKEPLSIIRNDDCLGCHNISDKTIGPAYTQVADRYEASAETIERLASKIIEGGGGLWGGAQMSKHPFLKEKDAKNIVKWILSLNGPEAAAAAKGKTYILKDLPPFTKEAQGPGWKVTAWTESTIGRIPSRNFPKISADVSPDLERIAPMIHFDQSAAFVPLSTPFYLRCSATIQIDRRGVYFFKLAKGSRALMKWEGLQVIADREDDHEINLKLEPGSYSAEIEYVSTGGQDSLALLWLPPGERYFQLVPEEAVVLP